MDKNEIMSNVMDAIVASGKSFAEIPQLAIDKYLSNLGIGKSQRESIYQDLDNVYNKSNVKTVEPTMRTADPSFKREEPYSYDTKNNDVKSRQPRKNVFSEIKRIL